MIGLFGKSILRTFDPAATTSGLAVVSIGSGHKQAMLLKMINRRRARGPERYRGIPGRNASFLALSLLLAALATPAPLTAAQKPREAPPEKCNVLKLKEGPLQGFPGLRLGEPVVFESADDSVRCFPLQHGSKRVAWLADAHKVNGRLFVNQCVERPFDAQLPVKGKQGEVRPFYEELVWAKKKGKARFVKLTPPLWDPQSSPAFCGKHVAYWGIERRDGMPGTNVYSVIFDLQKKSLVKKRFLGDLELEPDYRKYLPPPAWKPRTASFNIEQNGRVVDVHLK